MFKVHILFLLVYIYFIDSLAGVFSGNGRICPKSFHLFLFIVTLISSSLHFSYSLLLHVFLLFIKDLSCLR